MAAVSGSGYHGERFVTVCLYCHLEQGLEASKGLLDAESGECTDAYTALMVSVLEVVQPSVVLQMCDEHSRSRRVQRGRIAGYMGRAKKLGER